MDNNRLRDLVDSALSGQIVFHLALMLGTGYAGNAMSLGKLLEFGLPPQTASIFAALVGVAAAVAIDGGFKKQLPYAVSVWFNKKDRATGIERKKGFNFVVLILVILTGGTSLMFNLKVTPEITAVVIDDADGATQTALSATLSSNYERNLSPLEKAAQTAQSALVEAQKAAQTAEVDAVRAAQGDKMASLVKNRHEWALLETVSIRAKARRTNQRKVAAAEARVSEAEAALSAFIAESGAKVTSAQTGLIASYKEEKAQVVNARTRWGSAFIIFFVVAFIGFIGCTVVVVVYEDETGEDITHNPTIFKVITALLVRVKDAALSFIIRRGRLDFQYAMPTIGSYAPTPIAVRPAPKQRATQKAQNRNPARQKCKTESQASVNRNTEGDTEASNRTAQNGTESEPGGLSSDDRGEGWPTPDQGEEWTKFVKKARGWFTYACATTSETTRQRNLERWAKFAEHAKKYGYIAKGDLESGDTAVVQNGPDFENK